MFIQIYEQYRTSIFNYIFFRVGDADLADDLTSDVFVRLVDKYEESHRKGRPIAPWLFTIARNLVIDHHRRAGILKWSPLSEQAVSGESSNPARQAVSSKPIGMISRAYSSIIIATPTQSALTPLICNSTMPISTISG